MRADFRLTISLKQTQVMGQDSIHEYELEAVHEFAYLGSTITDSLSLETKLIRRIGKAATTLSRLKTSLDKQPSSQKYSCTRLVC